MQLYQLEYITISALLFTGKKSQKKKFNQNDKTEFFIKYGKTITITISLFYSFVCRDKLYNLVKAHIDNYFHDAQNKIQFNSLKF